ncbi:MAG TPA: SUMF1/EgtB/PvdO family nonheme iron enzyme [Nitrospira sp.]|nr:SUMF1/EgtB/PvdO family nonheme iron enzyme [Nitrospira sp.]
MKRTVLSIVFWLVWTGAAWAVDRPAGPAERPSGTGVIVHPDGYVLTAYHVVANARRVVIVTPGEVRASAIVVSTDVEHDLALLKSETVGLSEASLGHAGAVRLDQEVIAIGFPFGLREVSVTRGRINAVRTKGVQRVFQVDAAVNPGNSGGPLFNAQGEVIGILTTKFSHPSGIVPEGMAFAVPISYATHMLANIEGFDFTMVGKGRNVKKGRKEKEQDRLDAMLRTTVRIETARAAEASPPAVTPAPADAVKRAQAAQPTPPDQGETRNPAFRAPDQAAIQQVNEQLKLAQQEQLQALERKGNTVPQGMVLIPAGEFLMGADDGLPDTRPMHRIYVSTYWVDQHEVTNRQYRQCMESGGCGPPKDHSAYEDSALADHPVTNVTWTQARNYCGWRGKRLPTEAEWEKAARGIDGRLYPWGNNDDMVKARSRPIEHIKNGTVPVGSIDFARSPYGVADLVMNVSEWVNDWYAEDFYRSSPNRDPQGPARGSFKVLRGGEPSERPLELRASYRGWDDMTYWGPSVGFRCAQDGF